MGFWSSCKRGFVIGSVIAIPVYLALFVHSQCSVGGRAPSPSPGVATATPAVSEMAPARSLADGNGEDVVPVEEARGITPPSFTPQPEPASTVILSALTGSTHPHTGPSAYVGGPVAATPVSTPAPVETLAPKSINPTSEETSPVQPYGVIVRFDPWPAYLWPMVECLIQRESRGNPYAVGAAGERGLMQVGPANFTYLADRGISPDSLFDPATNLRAGWIIYLYWQNATGDGFWPWKSTRGGCA